MRKRVIAVIGSAEASPQDRKTAEEVGRLVAEAGAVLVTGGLGGVKDELPRGRADYS